MKLSAKYASRNALYATIGAVILTLMLCLPAKTQGKKIYRIILDDDIITPVISQYITESIDKAQKEGAVCFIIELDTPGGLLSSTRTIVKKIMNAEVPVVVYIAPKGARAGSAGVFITLAASFAAMAPSTNIGAAHPVDLNDRQTPPDALDKYLKNLFRKEGETKEGGEETAAEEPKPAPMEQKILNDTRAWAEAIAKERGRNAEWAQKAVTESVSVSDTQALELGIIDIIAEDTKVLVDKLDGRKVILPSGEKILETKGAEILDIPKNFRTRWLSILAHPNIAYILLMLGFYGLLFEFTHPGVGFPGIAGAISLILAFFGLQVLPTNYAGIGLIILGIAMFIAEIKVTSYGLLTIGGIASLFFGSLILFSSPYEFMRVSMPIILSFTLATLAVFAFLGYVVIRSRKRRVVTGVEGLIDEAGVIKSSEGRKGKIFVHGELWDFQSEDDLAIGDTVHVLSVSGMTLTVKKRS